MPAALRRGTVNGVYRRAMVLVCFSALLLGVAYVGTGMLENALRATTPIPAGDARTVTRTNGEQDSDPTGAQAPSPTPATEGPGAFTPGFAPTVADDVITRLNAERAAAGLPELVVDPYLVEEASLWSEQMTRNGYTHSSQERLVELSGRIGAGGMAENLHAPEVQCAAAISCEVPEAHPTSGVLHVDWMRSSSHRSTLLDPAWGRVGVGVYCDADGRMWATALFAAPAGVGVSGTDVVPYREPTVAGNDGMTCGGFTRQHNPEWRHTDVS